MNILLIAIDTLRADHLSCYGHFRLTSPHIDALAARGVRFAQHISPHIPTHPGYTTIFTGRDAFAHQIVAQGGKIELSDTIRTLPEILQKAGYFTAAADNLGRWFQRGFDLYEGYQWEQEPTKPWRKAEAVNATAQRVLKNCMEQDKPWLCFLHYWDPHTPYLPPPPFDRMFYSGDEKSPAHSSAYEMMHNYPAFMYYFQEWMPGLTDIEFPKAQYDAEIAYVDTALQHIFSFLAYSRANEDTLMIITADHGEELDEHQMYFDHHGLYETNLHVPLIMWHPEYFQGGCVRDELTSHMDLAPTILELIGRRDLAEEEHMQGRSLLQPLPPEDEREGGFYITECAWMKKRGFRTPRYKYIESLYDELHKRPPFELYDLQADPQEQHNLAEAEPQLLAYFQQRMQAFLEKRAAETGLPDPQSYQDITLRCVGKIKIAEPENHKQVEEDNER